MFYKKIILLALTCIILIAGCSTPTLYKQTEGNVATVGDKIKKARSKSDADAKPAPPLVIKNEMYVDKTPISLEKQPSWLKNRVVLRGDQLPFSFYSKNIIGNGVFVQYQPGLNASALVSVNYSGDVKGALELLAAKTGYSYTVQGNHIQWDAIVSKTFDIAFIPGATDYLMGDTSGGSAGSTGAAIAATAGGVSSNAQFSNLKGSTSVWKDLESTIKTLLSPQGTVMVSQASTSITVNDKPANVDLVAKYIANLNNNLARQVLVKVQVLEINLNSDFNYGINWSIIKRGFMGTNFRLNADYGTPVSITPFVQTPQVGFNPPGALTGTNGTPQLGVLQADPTKTTGVNFLIQALEQQGKVSVVTEPRVVCLNNQVSEINIVDKQGYAASVSSTTFSGGTGVAGGSSVTSTITPGLLETGLVLYVLPKIIGDRVLLQVNASLSSKVSIDPFTSGSGAGSASIQVPHTTQKQFNQRSVIGSGDTLILAGFRQVSNQAGAMQLFGQQALGGKGSTQTMTETVVLITPIVLGGII